MASTELDEQGIDSPDLYATLPARVPHIGCFYVVFPVRLKERQRGHAFEQLSTGLRACEALQQFLENEAGSEDLICAQQGLA